jgi:hypothetical protein
MALLLKACSDEAPVTAPDAAADAAPDDVTPTNDAPAPPDDAPAPPLDAPSPMDLPAPTDRPALVNAPRVVAADRAPTPDRAPPPVDNDGDGYRSDVDCNDNNIFVHPGAIDLCSNRVDENCDGRDATCTCTTRLHVVVDDYGIVNGPQLEAMSNGCWEVRSVNDRVPMAFRHCIQGTNPAYDCGGHIRQIDGDNWYDDETNVSHGATDAQIIRQCATRCGRSATPVGIGFVTMAASGGWRYESAGITPVVFFAQLYLSAANEAMQSVLFNARLSPRRAAPMITFTHATATQMGAWTFQVCGRLTTGNWMGFYVSSGRNSGMGPLNAAEYAAWSRALNACTR